MTRFLTKVASPDVPWRQAWVVACDACGHRYCPVMRDQQHSTVRIAEALGWSSVKVPGTDTTLHYCPTCTELRKPTTTPARRGKR